MPYSIPSDEEIVEALRYVMRRVRGVDSLTELKKLVLKQLKNMDPDYTVGHERLRRLAVRAPFIKTTIYATEGKEKRSLSGRCPVCGAKLEKTKNETVFGGTVTLGYKCKECPYWTTLKRRRPVRYDFEYKKENDKKKDPNNGSLDIFGEVDEEDGD